LKYSFTKPKEKELIDAVTKMWIGFIVFVVLFLLAFDFLIKFKIHSIDSSANEFAQKTEVAKKQIKKLQKNLIFLNKQRSVAENIFASNTILKDSIKNLFDLVPNQITLKKVIMKKKSLTIYGVTPSKDTFNFLLGSPLKSIFQSSNTIFYLDSDGWYRFVSINKIINDEDKL